MIGLTIIDSKGREYSEDQIAKVNDFIQGNMTMLLITKELAEAIIEKALICAHRDFYICAFCDANHCEIETFRHDDGCTVTRAKLLLEQEWGIKS